MSLLLNESTAMHLGDFIDCRYLTLSLEFYELEQSHTQLLVFDMLDWINLLLSDRFIASWKINNRGVSTKSLPSQARKVLQETSINLLQLNAFWKSEKINTKQQLDQWHRFIQRESCLMGWPQPGWSADFADYWNDHILPYAKDKAALRMALKQLFLEKDRHLVGVCYTPDIDCAIFLDSQNDAHRLRHGRILLSVSAFALGDSLSETAEKWKDIMITFAQKYKNLDGRVMLQPRALAYSSPYMTYFDDGQKYSQGYLPGVEWANVLSPRAQELLPWSEKRGPCEEAIQCRPLSGGGLLLASNKPVMEYDIDDALLLKSIVKDALYPGPGLSYPLPVILRPAYPTQANIRFPRKDWAIVPIFEEEIEIIGSQLCFSSNSI
jgi:hypothetical protein